MSVLAGAWLLLSILGGIGAIRAFGRPGRTTFERTLPVVFLLLAALFGVGAFGLLRRVRGARALLAAAGILALVVSGFSTYRNVTVASAPASEIAASEPDAVNALVLFRAGSAIAFLLSSVPLVLALAFLRHHSVGRWLGILPGPRRRPGVLVLVAGGALAVAALSFLLSKNFPNPRAPAAPEETAIALSPPETFLWSDQPVAFSPPPAPFTRERHAEGGRKGVSFTRYAVPPTRITVAEAFLEPAPNTPEEALAKLRLSRETFRSADSAAVGEPEPAAVATAPAYRTDYTIRERAMQHRGREIVALAGRHVFVFTFLGRDADLPVFEALLASARFLAPGEPARAARTPRVDAGPGPPSESETIHVGEHRLTVSVLPGWERVDYGARQEFRRGVARIALVDGGKLPPGTGAANLEDEWLVQRALRLFGHDARRWEVAARTRLPAGDPEALVVDTQEPLSHVFHTRTFVFVNGGRLLAAGMVIGGPDEGRDALDNLARSVRFLP